MNTVNTFHFSCGFVSAWQYNTYTNCSRETIQLNSVYNIQRKSSNQKATEFIWPLSLKTKHICIMSMIKQTHCSSQRSVTQTYLEYFPYDSPYMCLCFLTEFKIHFKELSSFIRLFRILFSLSLFRFS